MKTQVFNYKIVAIIAGIVVTLLAGCVQVEPGAGQAVDTSSQDSYEMPAYYKYAYYHDNTAVTDQTANVVEQDSYEMPVYYHYAYYHDSNDLEEQTAGISHQAANHNNRSVN